VRLHHYRRNGDSIYFFTIVGVGIHHARSPCQQELQPFLHLVLVHSAPPLPRHRLWQFSLAMTGFAGHLEVASASAKVRPTEPKTRDTADTVIELAVDFYNRAVKKPESLGISWQRTEAANRAILSVAFASRPTYLGARHLLPVIDNLCELLGANHVVEIVNDRELLDEALCMAMVGLDLQLVIARDVVSTVVYRLSRIGNDATNALEPIGKGDISGQVAYLFRGDPYCTQFVLDDVGTNCLALPSRRAASVAVNLGLLHFTEGLFSEDYLRVALRERLAELPTGSWHALHYLSDVFCGETLSCGACPCGEVCRAVLDDWP